MPNQVTVSVLALLLFGGLISGCADTRPPKGPGIVADERPGKMASRPEAVAVSVVAAQSGLMPDQLIVISLEAVNFTDGSLDCPQPGMAYPQVITPGYWVLLEGDSHSFDVRVSGDRGQICDTPRD